MEVKGKRRPPALRKFMHPRNPYKQPPSFKELSLSFKKFREHCIYDASGKIYFNFKNPDAVAILTTCLLERDYKLKVNIPKGSLVPTLPLRFNYLLWIEDLLGMVYPKISDLSEKVVGCDIGTGASAIYPLLGVRHFKWNFIASENDAGLFQSALDNVTSNDLQDKICLNFNQNDKFFDVFEEPETKCFLQKIKSLPTTEAEICDDRVAKKLSEYKIDFTMCNPPFFSSEEDMESTRRNEHASMPSSAATGSHQEKVVEGGEIAFITKMIKESRQHKNLVRLFSTLIGKQKDVKLVKKVLLEEKVAHFKMTEFCQGQTMRWGAVWTFDTSLILENYFSKKEKQNAKPLVLYVPRTQLLKYDLNSAWNLVNSWLLELKIKPQLFKKEKCCIGAFFKAYKATWLNQRRKKRHAMKQSVQENSGKRKAQSAEQNDELDCKRLKLDSSDAETCSEVFTDAAPTSPVKCEYQDINVVETSVSKVAPVASVSGLECLLKCNILIVQKNGVISIELKHLGGKGDKECVHQILQYLKNKVINGPHV